MLDAESTGCTYSYDRFIDPWLGSEKMCAKCAVEYELIEGKDANECKLRTSGNYCPAGHFKMPSGLCE
jgi:hypothetical protein